MDLSKVQQLTDMEAAELLQKAKKIVFKKIFEG